VAHTQSIGNQATSRQGTFRYIDHGPRIVNKHEKAIEKTTSKAYLTPPPMVHLDTILFRTGLILVACFLWTIILPGAVAYYNRIFFSKDVASQLMEKQNRAAEAIKKDQDEKRALINDLNELNRTISSLASSSSSAVKPIIDAREATEQTLRRFKLKISVVGFYNDPVSIVFMLNYLALACLVLNASFDRHRINLRRTFVIGFAAYLIFTWPNFFRNFLFNQYLGEEYERSRTVYAHGQWDIDRVCFILQEARVFGMMLLLSVLWQRWSVYSAKIKDNTRKWSLDLNAIDTSAAQRALVVSEQLSRWHGHSLLLAIAFLPFSWFFWLSITDSGDSRYVYTAVLIHVLWGVSWYFLTLPLLGSWRAWSEYRLLATGSMAGQSKDRIEPALAILQEIQPISDLQFAGTSIAAIASFLLPVIQRIWISASTMS
jgi:hypothetical protein